MDNSRVGDLFLIESYDLIDQVRINAYWPNSTSTILKEKYMSKNVEFVVKQIAETVLKNENYFSELDGAVGDGDFGYSLARGFEKVLAEWEKADQSSPGNFLKAVAQLLLSAVGGVSGTIWGTAFLRAGMAIGSKTGLPRMM